MLKKAEVVRRLMNKIVLEILEAKQRKFSHKWLFGPYTIPEWIPEAKQA